MDLDLDIFKIQSNNISPQRGRILIAEPFLPGSYFNRAIVLLVEYSDEGAVGFILNKPVDFPINNFYEEFPDFDAKVYVGGPVNPDYLYFVHTLGERIPGSIKVMHNLYWGGSFDVLKELVRDKKITASDVRFFLGYSGWTSGQLEEEIEEDSWLIAPIKVSHVMQSPDHFWIEAVKSLGGKYRLWENFPENPTMN